MALLLTDESGNGNTLTNNGADEETTEIPSGLSGATNSAKFVKANSDHMLRAGTDLTGFGDMDVTWTIEFWGYLTDNAAIQHVFARANSVAGEQCWQIAADTRVGQDDLEIYIFDSLGNRDAYSIDPSSYYSAWHHYAITCDAGNASATTFEFFVDGSSVGNGTAIVSDNISTIVTGTDSDLYIGLKGSGKTTYMDGYLKDIRIWNDVRTSTEISDNYQSFLVGNEAGLIAYYPFEALPSGDAAVEAARQTLLKVGQ